jgi:hypothetical protein
LSTEAAKHTHDGLFTQRQQGLMAAETTSNNKYSRLPLHRTGGPALFGWAANSPSGRATCRRQVNYAKRTTTGTPERHNPLFRPSAKPNNVTNIHFAQPA